MILSFNIIDVDVKIATKYAEDYTCCQRGYIGKNNMVPPDNMLLKINSIKYRDIKNVQNENTK